MIKALATASMLLMLGACGTPSAPPVAARPSPAGPPPPPMSDDAIACPADVKPCPDGRYISRNPANGCVFDACPGAGNN